MNTCDTCKWWIQNDRDEKTGDCASPIVIHGFDYPGNSNGDRVGATAWDKSISTGNKFGCIHHEPK